MKIKDAVYTRPVFEKVAEYELPKDISEWNEEILKNFFSELPYIPKDAGVEVVINNVDENKGYAKGSVVVFYKTRQINFPIIVKDFQLYPFDVFAAKVGKKDMFLNATERNVKTYLMTNEIAEIKNMYDYAYSQDLKTPGNVAPKPSVPLDQAYHDFVIQDQGTYQMRKLSFWANHARKEDLEKFALQLKAQPDVFSSFIDTTGDLIRQVIDLPQEKKEIIREKEQGKLDLNGVVDAKQALVTIDSDIFDVNNLKPIKAPAVCELRMYEYPSMEDFMESGASALGRIQASKVGKPIAGVVLAYKSIDDYCGLCPVACETNATDEESKRRQITEAVDQIFISADGNFFNIRRDYKKTGVLFYGTDVRSGIMESVIKNMEDKNIRDFFRFRVDNHNSGADKVFNPIANMNEGHQGYSHVGDNKYTNTIGSPNKYDHGKGILVLYGAGEMWECADVNGICKVWSVEGRNVYIGENLAIVPANVASIQKVNSVKTPLYKMVLGSIENIYLVPESSIVLSKKTMSCIKDEDIMEPSKPIQAIYEEKAISKVSMYVGENGYVFDGPAIEPLYKIAGLDKSAELSTREAIGVLKCVGANSLKAEEILKVAINRQGDPVVIYGVRDDYVNANILAPMEKAARIKSAMKEIADTIRTDLSKVASVIEDPEAVDVVLSLNFINEDNLNEYLSNIQLMKKVCSKLASMLVASRMGLGDLDEGAIRKAMDGLTDVVEGLENVKLALGK